MEPLHVGAQLDDLRYLRDGWLDGEGKTPPADGLDWLRGAFECNYPDKLPLPHLYPTETGGVHAEWSLDPNEITLDVNLGTRLGEWHILNMTSDDATKRTLNFNDAADWQWLIDRIKGMFGGGV